MATRKQTWAALTAAVQAYAPEGVTIERQDLTRIIKRVNVQIADDVWDKTDSTVGARRWRKTDGDRKWYIAEVTTPSGMRMVELYVSTVVASMSVYVPNGVVITEDNETGSPLDGYMGMSGGGMNMPSSEVSTNAKAWAAIDARIAQGL